MKDAGTFAGSGHCAACRTAFQTVISVALFSMTLGALASGAAERPKQAGPLPSHVRYASLPLAFEQNQGQANSAVKFLARGSGYAVFLTENEAVISLERSVTDLCKTSSTAPLDGHCLHHGKIRKDVFRLQWVGANFAPQVKGLARQTGSSNYLIGNDPAKWVRGVPSYSRVEYHGIYPSVGLIYYGNQRELEFDLDMAPGVDPGSARLEITGDNHHAAKVQVNSDGELVVQTRAGDVRFRKPVAYQPVAGAGKGRHYFAARYVMDNNGQVGFGVSGYDPAKPLVIDPVLSYSTYLGGADYNYATGIAVDASGYTYITGYTSSVDFPVSGGVQGVFAGGNCNTEVNTAPCFDAFVSKLNPQGTALIYSTYLGGTGDDEGVRVAVDSSGQAYVAGFTDSLDFPTAGPLQGSNGGGACGTTAYPAPCYDAFVAKLTASGSNLAYSTYLGGTGDDFSTSIAADSNGNAYVGGLTSASNFPVTYGALQTSYGGGPFDGFMAKINPNGSALVYSTYLGGSQEDHVNGIAIDSSGNAYLAGQTNSANFPVKGGFQPRYTAASCGSALSNIPCFEGFISELNPTGTALVYSTYLGGTAASYGSDIALDSSGAAYMTGWTTSRDFPVTPGAYDTAWGGGNEIFVAKIAPAGGAISYATYLGDIYPDQANTIAVDGSGDAWIAGFTYGGKFPVASPLQSASGGLYDAVVGEISPTGASLLFSTYLGGTGDDAANGLALDSSGNVYVAGDTFSTDFPVTPSVMTTGYTGGSYDAWVAKIGPQNAAGLIATPNPLVFASQEVNTTSTPSILKIGDAGSAALSISGISVTGDFAETSLCGQTVSPAAQCAVDLTFTPTATGTRTGTLVISDSAAGSPHTVHLSGYGTSGAVSLSASSLDFGSVVVGTTSTKTVALTNPAQSPLDISSIQAGGDYTESNNCGSVVNSGASCNISISFTPSAVGTSVGTVTITDTGLGSPQSITLTGTGVPPFSLSADQSLETILVGSAQTQFTVRASASGAFTNPIALGCTNIAPATCAFNPATIVPGQSSMLTVGNLGGLASQSLNFTVTGTAGAPSTATTGTSTSASGTMTASLALTVQIADFTLTASPANNSIQAGQSANYTLTITPLNGFNMPVSFGCSGAPQGATCSFSSSTLQVTPSGPVQDTLTVQTTARSLAGPPSSGWRGRRILWFAVLACWGFLVFGLSFARGRRRYLVAALRTASALFLVSLALASCGGGGSASTAPIIGTPAGTYTLDITVMAQTLSHTSQITLQVK
ncbi:MAG: choice-of-anchor D domain-containing protein [Acidobacteria bacterium]|nr:MAG: choice-of-anchor D domain-containing protein [Acidobacteriota bacterium]